MNIEQIKNILREIQAENRRKFKNTQAELKKAVSYIKKVYVLRKTLRQRIRQYWKSVFL